MNVSILLWGVLTAAAGYLLGSVNFAVVVSQLLYHEDVRTKGSGNAGMTNILRSYGKFPAFLTVLGDLGKGAAAVALGRLLVMYLQLPVDLGYVGGFFAILGHLFPVYFGFKGGKGVLTTLGAVLLLNPLVFLTLVVLLLPVVFITKIVSLTALIGCAFLPFLTGIFDVFLYGLDTNAVLFDIGFALLISLLITYMHRENIQRLREGREYKFGQKKN